MTTTQIPVLGPKRRFLTRREGLRLQGFPDQFRLPVSRQAAFAALGNAVHVSVVKAIAKGLVGQD
jgi:DNA (cytosine-5)-methyltransferase 1